MERVQYTVGKKGANYGSLIWNQRKMFSKSSSEKEREAEREERRVRPGPLPDQRAWPSATEVPSARRKIISCLRNKSEKRLLGPCHSQIAIALFAKMGFPSWPRINGTVGAKM